MIFCCSCKFHLSLFSFLKMLFLIKILDVIIVVNFGCHFDLLLVFFGCLFWMYFFGAVFVWLKFCLLRML